MPEKKERIKLLTPPGRLCFVSVFQKADPMEGSNSAPKYEATLLLDKEFLKKNPTEMKRYQAIKAAVDTACRGMFKKSIEEAAKSIRNFHNPLRDGSEKEHLNGFAGMIFFKASSKRRPGIVMPDGKTPITDPEAIYPGCYARLSIGPYAFDNKSKGVGLGLNNVMFVKDGERLDGGSNPEEDFGEVAIDDFGANEGDAADDELF